MNGWYRALVALAALAALAAPGFGGNWPGWRAPTDMGTTDEKDLPLKSLDQGRGQGYIQALDKQTDEEVFTERLERVSKLASPIATDTAELDNGWTLVILYRGGGVCEWRGERIEARA